MQMVYIPPMQMLSVCTNYRMQLMLPHWLGNETYSRFFKFARDRGDHIILDNGANEGYIAPQEQLVDIAREYQVAEMVLPDIMGNFRETLGEAKLFLDHFTEGVPKTTKYGFVLHGYNSRDAIDNFNTLTKVKRVYDKLDVIYIPRMLVTMRELDARLTTAEYIAKTAPDKKIHLLGASPMFLREVHLVRDVGLGDKVRSMDTSAPFVYALRDKLVDGDAVISRDHVTYFHGSIHPGQRRLAAQSMTLLDKWAQ